MYLELDSGLGEFNRIADRLLSLVLMIYVELASVCISRLKMIGWVWPFIPIHDLLLLFSPCLKIIVASQT